MLNLKFVVNTAAMTAAFALFGCNSDRPSPPKPSASASAPAKPSLPPGVDAELVDRMIAAAKACDVQPNSGQAQCPSGELPQLTVALRREPKPARTLPTLTYALSHSDPEVRAIGASLLGSVFRAGITTRDKQAHAPSAEQAAALLDSVKSLPESLARQVIPAAVHANMLTNRGAQLFEALKQEQRAQVQTTAYRYLMTHGRLEAFPQVRELAQSGSPAVTLAALESPRYMLSWSQAEQEAICPWAKDLLKHENSAISANAASVLSKCTGKDLDVLLDLGEKLAREQKFTMMHVAAYRDLCAKGAEAPRATDKQCDRTRRLLERIVDAGKADGRARAMSLSALAYQWPDARTLKLAKSHANDADAHLSRTATQAKQRLEGRVAASSKK